MLEGMATVWTAKGGRQGEREQRCLEHGVIGGGWEKLSSLAEIKSKGELAALYAHTYPEAGVKAQTNYVAQLWSLLRRMEEGQLVVLPLKTTGTIAVGRITGPYEYRDDLGDDLLHTRRVTWIATDVDRDAFDQDLLYSFGAFLTFGRVNRERAEERVLAAIEGKKLPARASDSVEGDSDVVEAPDIEDMAREQVRQHISQRFAGHELARLVAVILEALGYTGVESSPPGRDGGVDILAGSGALGLDAPRIVVQVKTGQAGIEEYRALRGLVENFRAEQGLLVAWRGFKGTVQQEARQSYFATRLWDAEDLMDELFSVYERLPDDLRSELPLKRVIALVPPE
jgi:restriction system protein